MRFERTGVGIAALALIGVALAPGAAAAGQRRFALVIGNDLGGEDTRALAYATEDARKFHAVLTELGGVNPADALVVENRGADDVRLALLDLERRMIAAHAAGDQTVLFVYYSGHAKDGELRLGGTRLPLEELRRRLAASSADIRVGILDSCRSGAVTRSKGVRRAPAFDVEAEAAEATRGLVMLTSSSANEDSQEADEIRGSYFSHHLISGLRGGADRSGDGRVTLSEAYGYAYSRTVADTADSTAGTQHPTFSYDLKGNGDFVVTEVLRLRAGLYFPREAPAGTYYLVHEDGFVAAEIVKPAAIDRRVALAPGRYVVKRRMPDRLRMGEYKLAAGQLRTVNEHELRDAPFSDDPVKGAARDLDTRLSLMAGLVGQSFAKEDTRNGMFPPLGLLSAELQLQNFLRRHWVWAFDVMAGGKETDMILDENNRVPFKFGEFTVGMSLLREFPNATGRFRWFVGGRVAFMFMSRTFREADMIPKQEISTVSPGLVIGARYRLTRRWGAAARLRVQYFNYNVEERRSLGYSDLGVAAAYDF